MRLWRGEDSEALRPMLRAFLQEWADRGAELLPTENNVSYLLGQGMAWASHGCPTLVAEQDGELLAYVQWGWISLPLDLRWTTCHALGSYTKPHARHRGIAGRLRQEAKRRCLDAGIERIQGPVHLTNTRGIDEFIQQGAWPTTVQMEVFLWV